MQTLKGLGDLHISTAVNILVDECIIDKNARRDAKSLFARAVINRPALLADGRFASLCANYLFKQNSSHHKGLKFIRQECKQLADIAREEFAEFERGYNHVYIEGPDNVFGTWAERRGIKVTYLDRDNEYYRALSNGRNIGLGGEGQLQFLREGVWISRISQSIAPGAVIFAGLAHIFNDYGLVGRLNAEGIALEVLPVLPAIDRYIFSREAASRV